MHADNGRQKVNTIPAHVPPELVHEYDTAWDPRMLEDPHARMRSLVLEAPPIFYTPCNGGSWVVTRKHDPRAHRQGARLGTLRLLVVVEARAAVPAGSPGPAPLHGRLQPGDHEPAPALGRSPFSFSLLAYGCAALLLSACGPKPSGAGGSGEGGGGTDNPPSVTGAVRGKLLASGGSPVANSPVMLMSAGRQLVVNTDASGATS